jgi:hypothetical protein
MGGFESGVPAGVAYVLKTDRGRALGAMAARDAGARVALMNARLESMFVVLIDVVGRRVEVDCNNQGILSSDAATRLLDSFSSFCTQFGTVSVHLGTNTSAVYVTLTTTILEM